MTARVRSLLLLMVVTAAAYANSLHNSFHYDDDHSIVNNIHIRDVFETSGVGDQREVVGINSDNLFELFADPGTFSVDADKGMFRPLLVFSYAVNYAIGGFDVESYHVANLGIHMVNTALVYELAGALIGLGAGPLIAGLAFAIHPLATEPVNYISSRSESLAALFYLLALLLFARGKGGTGIAAYASWLAMALGLLCKSTVITLPAVLMLYDYLFLSRTSLARFRSHALARFAPYAAVAVVYIGVISANGFLPRSVGSPVRSGAAQFLTQIKAIPYYLEHLFVPIGLNVEPQFAEQTSFSTLSLIAGAFCISLACLIFVLHKRRAVMGLFLTGWGLLASTPVLVFPLNVFVNDRRMYLPLAAFAIGLAWLSVGFVRRASWSQFSSRGILLTLAGVGLAVLTVQRNRAWADDFSLWTASVQRAPLMPRPHLYLGNAHKDAAYLSGSQQERLDHWRQAQSSYRRVLEVDDSSDLALRAMNNLGSVFWELGDFELAEKFYRQAVDAKPNYADALINLGSTILLRGRRTRDPAQRRAHLSESITYYERALRLRPNHHQAHGNLGVAYQDLGNLDAAEKAYQRSLVLNPRDWKIIKNVANLQLAMAENKTGEARRNLLQKARTYFRRSLRQNPNYEDARRGLERVDQLLSAPPADGETETVEP